MAYSLSLSKMVRMCVIFILTIQTVTSDTNLDYAITKENEICKTQVKCRNSEEHASKGKQIWNKKPLTRIIESMNESSDISLESNATDYSENVTEIALGVPLEPNPCCESDCSCDKDTCIVEGTCCLDALDYIPSVEESKDTVQMTCEYPQLRPYNDYLMTLHRMANAEHSVRMIRRCRNRPTTGSEVVGKCEHPDEHDDIFTKVPVMDRVSLFSYQNKFCAQCNDIPNERWTFWTTRMECVTGTYQPKNIKEIAHDILTTGDCNLLYIIPDELQHALCRKTISTCNVTGKWITYNSTIEAGCLAYTREYTKSYERYRNIFCYMCNTNSPSTSEDCNFEPVQMVSLKGNVPFSADLDVQAYSISNDIPRSTMNECTHTQIYDSSMKTCHEIHCKFPKTLKDKKCVNMVERLRGVTYDVYIELMLLNTENKILRLDEASYPGPLVNTFTEWLNRTYSHILDGLLQIVVSVKQPPENIDNEISLEYVTVFFQLKLLNMTDAAVVDIILSLDKTMFDIQLDNNTTLNFHSKVSHWLTGGKDLNVVIDQRTNSSLMMFIGEMKGTSFGDFRDRILDPTNIESITIFNGCPYVVLNFVGELLNQTNYGYYIERYKTTIAYEEVMVKSTFSMDSGLTLSLTVCLDTFISMVEEVTDKDTFIKNANLGGTGTLAGHDNVNMVTVTDDDVANNNSDEETKLIQDNREQVTSGRTSQHNGAETVILSLNIILNLCITTYISIYCQLI